MIRKIINMHWNLLQITPELQETFHNNLFVVFKVLRYLQSEKI